MLLKEGDHFDCDAYNQDHHIELRNWLPQPKPGIPAKYIVFETGQPANTFGAGMCRAQTQCAIVRIPAGRPFTVQAIENDLDLTL
jgi:hypothetical protein